MLSRRRSSLLRDLDLTKKKPFRSAGVPGVKCRNGGPEKSQPRRLIESSSTNRNAGKGGVTNFR